MIIQSSKLLPPTSRIVRFYQCSVISTTGPQINGKLDLSDVQIPYDSQFTTHMTLNPESVNQPLMFGFLGNAVTFILLKITYDETNPMCSIEEDQYIEYWYEDQPTQIRYINKLLILTGNSVKRIPQIYLSNPGTVKVYVDALVANLEQSDINLEDAKNNVVTFNNLYYNSVISDTKWNTTDNVSGSTQFQVLDINNKVVLYLDYSDISLIKQDDVKFELTINTFSGSIIHLIFLSLFEMYQAQSRINWVMTKPLVRYLTKDEPDLDLISPVITMNSGLTPIIAPNIYGFPVNRDPSTGEFIVLPTNILNYFISGITDNRDGDIIVDNATVKIREYGHIESLTGITILGVYDITISIKDIANNQTSVNYIIILNDEAPVITFYPCATGSTFEMIPGTGDISVPSIGVTRDDILRKTVDNVYDSVDGVIPNSSVLITVSGGTTLPILTPSKYKITYSVSNLSSIEARYDKFMVVVGNNIIEEDDTFLIEPSMLDTFFLYSGATGTTASLVISGQTSGETFLIENSSTNTFIFDIGGVNEHEFTTIGEYLELTLFGTLYRITFNGLSGDNITFNIEQL